MNTHESHLQPDGSTFPPVSADPPPPPGYVDPLKNLEDAIEDGLAAERGGTKAGAGDRAGSEE